MMRRLVTRGAAISARLLVLFAIACSDSDDPTRPGGDDPTRPGDVEAEVSEAVSTVVTVRWTTAEPSIGYVEYGPTKEMEFNTPLEAEPTTEHEQMLLGLTTDTLYHYRVVTWDGADAGASDAKEIRTGDLQLGMPAFEVEGSGHDEYIVTSLLGTNVAAIIINPEGKIVWWHRPEGELNIYRTRLARDGKSVLFNYANVSGTPSEDSAIVRVALDGSKVTPTPVPFLAHDFVEHEDGTLAAIANEHRDFEGEQLRGDRIVEVSPDGDMKTIWTSWDCFDPAADPGEDLENGWTFANALDYDPAEDAYYLGMRNFGSIAKIDRATGECEWVLGFTAATIELDSEAEQFIHQHQFQVRGNRLVVMDNDGAPGNVSRLIEYEIDFEANLATQVWTYSSTPTVYTFVLGEPIRFDNGETFVNWSAAGQMERVGADGMAKWKLNSGAGAAFGFQTLANTLYPSDARSP